MRRKLIAGNWKMNGLKADGLARIADLAGRAKGGAHADMAVCPPATLLFPAAEALKGSSIALGAQDCHAKESGAHTGDISAPMIKEAGCRYVIVGHSERRANHSEKDADVAAKAAAAHKAGLIPIICVGESEAERNGGKALDVVRRQVKESVPAGATSQDTVIAYEPIWAIGTGRTPTLAEIAEVHAAARAAWTGGSSEALRILYGGSVKGSNAKEILAVGGVDGALVGGASLDAADFWRIVEACA